MATNLICILYIDDSPAQLEAVRAALPSEAYQVRTALTVHEALEQLQDGAVDLVLIDYIMPNNSGAEVLKILKQQKPSNPNTRFFLYTTDKAAHLDYQKLGFDGAFTLKGHSDSLLPQLTPLARFIKLRRMSR